MSQAEELSPKSAKEMMAHYLEALDANNDNKLTGEEQVMAVKIMLETLKEDGDASYDEIYRHQKTVYDLGPVAMAEYLNNMLREMLDESRMSSGDVQAIMPNGIEPVMADDVLAVLQEVFEGGM